MGDVRARLESIDEFRGFAILLMVLADYLEGPAVVPGWLKHAQDVGLTEADIVAPLFILAIGLTFGLSWRSRKARDGVKKTIQHFVIRYLALIGIGALLTVLGNLSGMVVDPSNWGLLQAIGVAGLITLAFIGIPMRFRWLAGAALLAAYQVLLGRFWLADVLQATHGGLKGALGWGAMMILATVLGDLFHDEPRRKWFPDISLGVLLVGIALALLVPVSKHRVSASYVLVTLGGSGLVFWLFHLLDLHSNWTVSALKVWGRNPLVLYVLHGLMLGIFVVPGAPGWYAQAPAWLVVIQAAALVGVLSGIGWWLDRRGLTFTL
ncbi:MAG: heparan-alpha-glucosaminide N-acetyltransferase domain-containing protein [Candidatus Cryosericum sp.]